MSIKNEQLKKQLIEKVNAEYDAFRAHMLSLSAEEVFNHTYECMVKQNVKICVETYVFSNELYEKLLAMPDVSEFLYHSYMKYDADEINILWEIIQAETDRE